MRVATYEFRFLMKNIGSCEFARFMLTSSKCRRASIFRGKTLMGLLPTCTILKLLSVVMGVIDSILLSLIFSVVRPKRSAMLAFITYWWRQRQWQCFRFGFYSCQAFLTLATARVQVGSQENNCRISRGRWGGLILESCAAETKGGPGRQL